MCISPFRCVCCRKEQDVQTGEKLQELLQDGSILNILAACEGGALKTSPLKEAAPTDTPPSPVDRRLATRKRVCTSIMTTTTDLAEEGMQLTSKKPKAASKPENPPCSKRANNSGRGRGRGRGRVGRSTEICDVEVTKATANQNAPTCKGNFTTYS